MLIWFTALQWYFGEKHGCFRTLGGPEAGKFGLARRKAAGWPPAYGPPHGRDIWDTYGLKWSPHSNAGCLGGTCGGSVGSKCGVPVRVLWGGVIFVHFVSFSHFLKLLIFYYENDVFLVFPLISLNLERSLHFEGVFFACSRLFFKLFISDFEHFSAFFLLKCAFS